MTKLFSRATEQVTQHRIMVVLGMAILMILAIFFLAQRLIRTPSVTTGVGASWHGLTIGVSTRHDVHTLYGSPSRPDIFSPHTDNYFTTQPPGNEPDMTFIFDDRDVLSFIYIDFRRQSTPFPDMSEFEQLYGEPQYQVRGVSGCEFLYVSQGIVLSTDLNAVIIFNVEFFSPCSLDCTKKFVFGINPILEPYQTLTP